MAALLADAWFYVFLLGFLGSLLFFFALRARFKESVQDVHLDDTSLETEAPIPVRLSEEPVRVTAKLPDETLKLREEASAAPKTKVQTPLPAPSVGVPAVAGAISAAAKQEAHPRKDPAVTTGSLNPAVVYLQNLKIQMEHFEKEIQQLRSDLAGVSRKSETQFESVLKHLDSLQSELHATLREAPASAPVQNAPSARPAFAAPEAGFQLAPKSASPAESPAPVRTAPSQEPPPLRATSPAPAAAGAAPAAAPPPESAAPQDDLEIKPKIKGPVWPV